MDGLDPVGPLCGPFQFGEACFVPGQDVGDRPKNRLYLDQPGDTGKALAAAASRDQLSNVRLDPVQGMAP